MCKLQQKNIQSSQRESFKLKTNALKNIWFEQRLLALKWTEVDLKSEKQMLFKSMQFEISSFFEFWTQLEKSHLFLDNHELVLYYVFHCGPFR